MALLPEVEVLLTTMAEAGAPPISQMSVDEARAASLNMVLLAGEPIRVYRSSDALPGDPVLAGFSCPVAEFFEIPPE